jgi:lysophospholipase L1-like esterase
MIKQKKKFDFASLILFLFSSLFCLLILEIIMRGYIFGNNAWSYSQMKSVNHVGVAGILKSSEYLDILWELKPNLNTQYKLWPFKTNSRGLRDQEYSLKAPPSTFRVAVVGDSLTMAEGVAIEDAYHSILENRFNEEDPKKNYEFINFGVAGYSLVQYVSTIKRKVLEFKPNMILIGFCAANDSKKPNLEAFNKPYKVKPERNGFVYLYSMQLLGNIYQRNYKLFRGRLPGYNADPNYVDARFKELSEISEENNIPIVIAYIDNKAASADFNAMQDIAKKYGFEFIDATTNFSKELQPGHMIYLTDGHPNGAANKILADTLYPLLTNSVSMKAGL